jgi:hypothetical protein
VDRTDGSVLQTYWKHHPVPGEPIVVGTEPITAVDTELGRLAGALCYDYDYPSLAAEHGRLGVDLLALPSSDWRGIDPIHSEMAAVRAIEQGVAIVRSTRFGLSAGIDPHGIMRARQSSFESRERVLLFELPQRGQPTIYREIGDLFVLLCLSFVVAVALYCSSIRSHASPTAFPASILSRHRLHAAATSSLWRVEPGLQDSRDRRQTKVGAPGIERWHDQRVDREAIAPPPHRPLDPTRPR